MTLKDEISDEALMTAYREANDSIAFERLYRRHRGGLYRYFLRQCGSRGLAEELFQDVWLNVIRTAQTYVAEARFVTYLYCIAHNRLIDHYRRSAVRPSIVEPNEDAADPIQMIAARPSAQPEQQILAKEQIERFKLLLAALPDAQREAFLLHEDAGLSIVEIALATGVNTETAKSRLRYAMAKLRQGMAELI